MKIKIIIPPYVYHPPSLRKITHSIPPFPPYGAGCLVSALRSNSYSVSIDDVSLYAQNLERFLVSLDDRKILENIADFLISDKPDKKIENFAEKIFKCILQDESDVIGISILSRLELACALLLAKKIKEKMGAKIVLGGALMTEYAASKSLKRIDSILGNFKFVDFVIFGEGCVPFLALLEHLQGLRPIETVPNLAYRDNGKISIRQRTFYSIQDMPIPDFDGLDLEKYRIIQYSQTRNWEIDASKLFQLPYQISRGCTQGCSFCDFYLTDPQIAFKNHQKVISELSQLKEKYQTKSFYFCECKINISYTYLEKLCDAIIDSNLDIVWRTTASVNNMDLSLLEKMKASGCYSLTWGIESGSNRLLERMNKGFSSEKASEILKLSHKIGIVNVVNLICGFVQETEQDIDRTVQFIKNNAFYIDWVRIFDFALIPDTPIFNRPEEYGIENIAFDFKSPLGFGRLAFDEKSGMKWKEKLLRQQRSFKKIQWAVDRYIFSGKKHILKENRLILEDIL